MAVKDIAGNQVRMAVGITVVREYAGGVQDVYIDLRPLAFGAAWKVLDLLVELALTQAGVAAAGGSVTITEKVKRARTAVGLCPPLSSDAPVWATLTAVYAATEEVRHSLVHRQAEVDRASVTSPVATGMAGRWRRFRQPARRRSAELCSAQPLRCSPGPSPHGNGPIWRGTLTSCRACTGSRRSPGSSSGRSH